MTYDIRFPTSLTFAGSDAMNPDPDYSAAYVVLETDDGHEGHGLTFTIGRGTEVCVAAIEALAPQVVGSTLGEITADFAGFWRRLTNESQLRWLGPEKGVIHLATGALVKIARLVTAADERLSARKKQAEALTADHRAATEARSGAEKKWGKLAQLSEAKAHATGLVRLAKAAESADSSLERATNRRPKCAAPWRRS